MVVFQVRGSFCPVLGVALLGLVLPQAPRSSNAAAAIRGGVNRLISDIRSAFVGSAIFINHHMIFTAVRE